MNIKTLFSIYSHYFRAKILIFKINKYTAKIVCTFPKNFSIKNLKKGGVVFASGNFTV